MFNYNPNATLSGMPQMNTTLNGWEVPITLTKVVQTVTDGDVSYAEQIYSFMGVWQPLRDEQLQFKPEGQRSWSWYWLHVKSGILNLTTSDKVVFNNERYKVMSVKDYSLNGFVEYELVKDYQ